MSNKDKIHVLSRGVLIDQGHILLCKTVDLEKNFFFLPGGHVEHGEGVEKTLLRELIEETGSICKIKKFLGCLEYSFVPGHNSSICHNHEYNFIFEITSENLKADIKTQLEEHIELVWIPLEKLSEIDFRAEPLKKLLPKWLNSLAVNSLYSEMI